MKYIVTKPAVLKTQVPQTFETNQTWINENKKFMKVHGMTYEKVEEPKKIVVEPKKEDKK